MRDERVLAALEAVPRDRFVPTASAHDAARDEPIAIGQGQTTSQPSLIAAMLAALQLTGDERVLEVGTGTGYEAALLGHIAGEVHTVERHAPLAGQARANLEALGLDHVHVVVGDGTRGLPDHAPYDAVVVAAAADTVPRPLIDQLVDGGRLVAPVGGADLQYAVVYERRGDDLVEVRRLTGVRFVPLVPDDPGA